MLRGTAMSKNLSVVQLGGRKYREGVRCLLPLTPQQAKRRKGTGGRSGVGGDDIVRTTLINAV